MRLQYVLFLALLSTAYLSLSSCLVEGPGIGSESGTKTVVDPNDNPAENLRLICDPFKTNSQVARERGFFGNIYYIPDTSICHGKGHGDDGDSNDHDDGDSKDHGNGNGHANDDGDSKDHGNGNGNGNSAGNDDGDSQDHGNGNGNGNSGNNGNTNSGDNGNSGNGKGKNKKVEALDEEDDDGGACFKNVEEYIQKGTLVDANIYMDRLFVQSQPFTTGLLDNNGNSIDLQGVRFFENFAVDMSAQLQLGAAEQPGYYQLALISDDGALLKRIDENGNEVVLVNNNGSHPTQMACAETPIYLDRSSKIPIKIQQYQGARKNISMIAMWRPWDPNNKEATSLCGKRGNGYFFDSTKTPIKPKKPFYELLVNKWKVLQNENLVFPLQDDNPCAPKEETLLLTGFSITSVTRSSVTVNWISNVPSSSQLEFKNIATGAISYSPANMALTLNHTVTQLGLSPNTLYSVRAISTTPGGQTVKTDEGAFKTPR